MKVLLAAVNAKYIHSNPAVHSLKASAEMFLRKDNCAADHHASGEQNRTQLRSGTGRTVPSAGNYEDMLQIELGEYTINHTTEAVRADIYRRRPDVLGFSCYIWNITYVRTLVRDLHRLLPETEIWLGGPEVSWHAEQMLTELPEVRGIMSGPGEMTFARLAEVWAAEAVCAETECAEIAGCLTYPARDACYARIPGLIFRTAEGSLRSTGEAEVMPLADIPFWYSDLTEFENRIIYYESSRGCPFACSYCLSSIDRRLQFRRPEQVEQELQFFLDRKVPQVKFIDRTFNCRESHALRIWRYLAAHDNGITNFHFEIAADLLTEPELEVLAGMRPGLVQLEIGVQSTNPETVREIRRVMDVPKLAERVARVNSWHNIHQHLDLIAGLPFEDYESFGHSFDDVYAMEPEQLQLGFLKVLKGARMEEMAGRYGLIYTSEPPYEVLATKWLPYEEVLRLKGIEEMVEMYYNSGQFPGTLRALAERIGRPFLLYERLASYWASRGLGQIQSNRMKKYEVLLDFACREDPEGGERYRDLLTDDCCRREHMKNRPAFAREQTADQWQLWKDFVQAEAREHHFLEGFDGVSYREMLNLLHGEFFGGAVSAGEEKGSVLPVSEGAVPAAVLTGRYLPAGRPVLRVYDYRHRDPLTSNARMLDLPLPEVLAYAKFPGRPGRSEG